MAEGSIARSFQFRVDIRSTVDLPNMLGKPMHIHVLVHLPVGVVVGAVPQPVPRLVPLCGVHISPPVMARDLLVIIPPMGMDMAMGML